jgi:hypothetical protein
MIDGIQVACSLNGSCGCCIAGFYLRGADWRTSSGYMEHYYPHSSSSGAAAGIAGLAAVLVGKYPSLNAAQVKGLISGIALKGYPLDLPSDDGIADTAMLVQTLGTPAMLYLDGYTRSV